MRPRYSYGVFMTEYVYQSGIDPDVPYHPPVPDTESMTVYVLDSDVQVNDELCGLARSVGVDAHGFVCVHAFLTRERAVGPSCLVLDVRLRGTSGITLQNTLKTMGDPIPVIFVTGFGDIAMSVRAMKAGAADFLTKPVHDQAFLDSILSALECDRKRIVQSRIVSDVTARYRKLSQREQEVMSLVTAGILNKNIASHLGISEITVKIHRSNAMRKMQASTFADFVMMAHSLGIAKLKHGVCPKELREPRSLISGNMKLHHKFV
jgi:FixJ family two-component response regulator